jgi:hypothetical protein
MIMQSSLDAWIYMQSENKVNENQTIILDWVKSVDPMPVSNSDIAKGLGWGINRVTPRVLELRKMNKLVHVSYKVDLFSGRTCMTWALPETVRKFCKYDPIVEEDGEEVD